MAFPKNKTRQLQIGDDIFQWCCVQEMTLNKPIDVEADETGILPPLEEDIEWLGYEEVYGYNSLAKIWIQHQDLKLCVHIHAVYFFLSVRNKSEVKYLNIKPSLVKKIIQYLQEQQLFVNGYVLENTAHIFRNEIRADFV